MTQPRVIDMGDGVVVRHATERDIDAVVASNGMMWARSDEDEPTEWAMTWTRALMDGSHPTTRAHHFTVAVDTRTKKIVSACGYIPQRWTYGCADRSEPVVEFGVGRPEIVQTHRDYRRRGLVRTQFDLLHEQADRLGTEVLVIDGIHQYYRQFGYEYALERYPYRRGVFSDVPKLGEKESELVKVREATVDDVDLLVQLYQYGTNRSTVACTRDADSFRFHLTTQNQAYRRRAAVIETLNGEPIGALIFHGSETINIEMFELCETASWLTVCRPVMRWLRDACKDSSFQQYALQSDHPLYEVCGRLLGPIEYEVHPAWYVRVQDIPCFLQKIIPVLEQRLASSASRAYTGELAVSFYREGFKLVFDHGRISVEPFRHTVEDQGHCGFVGLTFLQVLFGYRSFSELHHLHPDCHAKYAHAEPLLNALFPKRSSYMLSIS